MDVFQAARIYIKSPDVRLFNIPSVFAGRRVDVKCVTLAEMGGNDRKSTHERTVQRVQGTWKVQQEGNISAYIYIRTTHASPRFALHHVPRLVSVQCLTTRPGYPLSAASLSLQPPYPSFLLPPLHWIRFSFFSPSIDRYHRVRSRRFVPLINFFLSIPLPKRERCSSRCHLSSPRSSYALVCTSVTRWSQPPLLTFLLTVFTDPISYLFLPPLDIILFAITLPPCLR